MKLKRAALTKDALIIALAIAIAIVVLLFLAFASGYSKEVSQEMLDASKDSSVDFYSCRAKTKCVSFSVYDIILNAGFDIWTVLDIYLMPSCNPSVSVDYDNSRCWVFDSGGLSVQSVYGENLGIHLENTTTTGAVIALNVGSESCSCIACITYISSVASTTCPVAEKESTTSYINIWAGVIVFFLIILMFLLYLK